MEFIKMNKEQLTHELNKLDNEYQKFKEKKLKLDMSRGKPCSEQMDISMAMLDCVNSKAGFKAIDGTDCRNYGGLDGISEAKEIFSTMVGVNTNEIIIGGNSSLNMMYDTLLRAMTFGVVGSEKPWSKLEKVKFLCPSPGYDRHFGICEDLGIEMITVEMTSEGPDMEQVKALVAEDASIKGIWCVPKYSNPDGITYSDKVVDELASMKTAANDFRIMWDNAYVVHHLNEKGDELKDILSACKNAGNPDRVFIFSSTSKLTFPGAGVAMMASSEANLAQIKKHMNFQTIGPDKLNQLRHVKFFKDMSGIEAHMIKQADILKPKFDVVLDILEKELADKAIAEWNKPNGGYFISLNTMNGCAKAVVQMAAEAGVALTKAGATFPYGMDPNDKNIRIAPTFPPVQELKIAIELLCVCIKRASIMKLLEH